MVVGRWVTEEKHRIIKRYIDASWAARQKFTSQRTYIDLFAGTGRVKIKHTDTFQDGGPLAAWQIAQQKRGVFSDFFIADANPEFLAACDTRLRERGAPLKSIAGRADETIDWVGPVRFLVCRGHETITEITSYDRCNRDQEEQEPEGAEAVPR
nr:three-Cys-motif partner protein TcmP [Burkholderia multivorans]